MRRHLSVALLLGLLTAGSAANAGTSGKPVTWQFDLGYSMVQSQASDLLKNGYTLGFGAVLRPNPKKPIGWRFEMAYDWWDVNSGQVINGIRADDGDADQWAFRGGIQFEPSGDHVKFIGGVGIGAYRLHGDITEEVWVPGYICDPWYWWYCYPGLVPGDIILADKTLTKLGYYATAGISIPLENSDIFIEAQYHRVDVEEYFETIPITFGWRF